MINTAEGRRKTTNMRRDPRVAISVRDEANGYRYMEVRGRVTELTHDGADAHINQLLKAYAEEDDYTRYRWSAEEVRVIAKVRPEHVVVWVE